MKRTKTHHKGEGGGERLAHLFALGEWREPLRGVGATGRRLRQLCGELPAHPGGGWGSSAAHLCLNVFADPSESPDVTW